MYIICICTNICRDLDQQEKNTIRRLGIKAYTVIYISRIVCHIFIFNAFIFDLDV